MYFNDPIQESQSLRYLVDLEFFLCYKDLDRPEEEMTPFQDWLAETKEKIDTHKKSFTKTEARKFKLPFVERIADRTEHFSSMCGGCYQNKGGITTLLDNLEGPIRLSPMAAKGYHQKIKTIVSHLRKEHKMVPAGTFTAMGNGIGSAAEILQGLCDY